MSPSSPIRFEVWGKERLRFEELPTVRDVLARVDAGLLASTIAECRAREAEWEGTEPPATADALREAEDVVRALLATTEAPADEERVLLPSATVREDVLRASTFRAVTESVLVHRSDLALYALHLDPECDRNAAAEAAPPNGWAYEASPWEEILAMRAYVPERFCEREAYAFLADIASEATFFGTDPGVAEAGRSEFAACLDCACGEVGEALSDVAFDLEWLGIRTGRTDEQGASDARAATLRDRLLRVGSEELWRDCVDLSRRLA